MNNNRLSLALFSFALTLAVSVIWDHYSRPVSDEEAKWRAIENMQEQCIEQEEDCRDSFAVNSSSDSEQLKAREAGTILCQTQQLTCLSKIGNVQN